MANQDGSTRVSLGRAIAGTAWFLGATVIAAEVFGVEPRRGNLWIVVLIFVAPALVFMLGRELALRIKHGRRTSGRHRSDR